MRGFIGNVLALGTDIGEACPTEIARIFTNFYNLCPLAPDTKKR
jgi:hypothetical protein